MGAIASRLGSTLAAALTRPQHLHGTGPATTTDRLHACLKPGDVLLVEGNSRISSAIKFLTQSTWSHAALYVGPHLAASGGNPDHCFVEADLEAGVRSVGIDQFENLHTRICRPFAMAEAECKLVADFAIKRIGDQYDLRNVIDLARFFLPNPPVPARFRRKLLAFGSGDPSRAICSTLIAQAFQSVHYPILPVISRRDAVASDCPGCADEIYHIRHHSLFTPKDFDISAYFSVVKPLETEPFDFKALSWED